MFKLRSIDKSALADFYFTFAPDFRLPSSALSSRTGSREVLSPADSNMARGPKKHLKRVAAPKHWMLDKLTGVFAPRPSTGPHKLRECLPLIIFLRNRLKYALTGDEVKKICMQRFIKIDGKVNDTIRIDLETGKITDFIKFDTANLCMVTGGANLGRIGVITNRERHPGSFDVVHVKDSTGNSFATRLSNIFVIGKGNKPWVSLPRGKGIRLTIAEERDKRLAAKQGSS
ncbi:putative 40S ribosomal protein S4-like isoform 3 [Scophthalmus maximus]|uniref:Putative 40S ribosomal protein S4-like isoform 3 n=1 Tax=Scophthalmus maximus TaxID=52904 RepID=A0A2U9B0R3_SCOMX|nr:putative 40S ribosomal protein S4-like isoform 3 [Scophthalmus maximus]